MKPDHPSSSETDIRSLEQLVANTCFCKLKASCPDKNSSDCMRHRHIYAEFMAQKRDTETR